MRFLALHVSYTRRTHLGSHSMYRGSRRYSPEPLISACSWSCHMRCLSVCPGPWGVNLTGDSPALSTHAGSSEGRVNCDILNSYIYDTPQDHEWNRRGGTRVAACGYRMRTACLLVRTITFPSPMHILLPFDPFERFVAWLAPPPSRSRPTPTGLAAFYFIPAPEAAQLPFPVRCQCELCGCAPIPCEQSNDVRS